MADQMQVSTMEERSSATMHGVFVGGVSPVKTRCNSKSYFEANFSDGKKTARVALLEPRVRGEVEEAEKSQRDVAITRCSVKRVKFGNDKLEIVAGEKSAIISSPKKFKIEKEASVSHFCSSTNVVISDLERLREHQRVSVVRKVQLISSTQELKEKDGTMYSKQEFTVADSTAICRGVAWEQYVDFLQDDSSYKFSQVTIRSFNGQKYISLREKSKVEQVENIGDVVIDEIVKCKAMVLTGEIVAIMSIESYAGCRNCNSKILEIGRSVAECKKCSAKMKVSKCVQKNIACIILEDKNNKEHRVSMFSEILEVVASYGKKVCQTDDVGDQLLSAPKLCYTVSPKEIFTSVCTA